jgi:hypothetical protein
MYTVYVLFIVYVTLPPGISPIAVGINNNNNKYIPPSTTRLITLITTEGY